MEYKPLYDPPKKPGAEENTDKNPGKKNSNFAAAVIILCCFVAAGITAGAIIAYSQEVPEVADLRNYKPNLSTTIFDDKGEMVSQLFAEQRTLVKLADIPINLQNAFIAKEDPNFYQHNGFDFRGIVRAAFNNAIHGKVVEGGSTITQQLARNLFLTREKTFGRKIREMLLSLQLEKYYTKNEILELYCNQIYFGAGAYGVEAAARTYFGKHVHELLLHECAMLAALPQAPNQFNPYRNPDLAKEKRDVVLVKMAERNYISEEQKAEAIVMPIELSRLEVKNAPYFVEYVRQRLESVYGNTMIYKGGLRVYTSLDSRLQGIAQQVFTKHINNLSARVERNLRRKPEAPLQGAMIAMDPNSGQIKVLIGGIDYSRSEFNRAVQAKRQTGSAFKPIVYTTALENGFRVSDIIVDSPIVYKNADGTDWRPENFSGRFSGPDILLNGITHSKNVMAVKLLNTVGIGTVRRQARRMGIESPLSNDLTLALGSSSMSLMELVNLSLIHISEPTRPY